MCKYLVVIRTINENPPFFESPYKYNCLQSGFEDLKEAKTYISEKFKQYPIVLSHNDLYERKAYIQACFLNNRHHQAKTQYFLHIHELNSYK